MVLTHKKKSAFTLIELSIVLVVIGLIVAGVLSGKTLIRQGQMRSVVSEFRTYDTAILAFKTTYDQLPGDFDNAYSYWGTNCASTASLCNGNGSNKLGDYAATRQEMFMAFKHLSLAGLIPGAYTGFSSAANYETAPGVNTPTGLFPNSEWAIRGRSGAWLTSAMNAGLVSKNVIMIGRHNYLQQSENEMQLFTPQETGSLDTKIDDGMPITGQMNAEQGTNLITGSYSTACFTASSAVGTAAVYTYTAKTPECIIDFGMTASKLQW